MAAATPKPLDHLATAHESSLAYIVSNIVSFFERKNFPKMVLQMVLVLSVDSMKEALNRPDAGFGHESSRCR